MSQPTYDWADDQYRAAGLDPAQAKFVGVKNMMNFRFGYAGVMKGFFVLDLPGPTPPDMRLLPFSRITRPVFPLDRDLVDPADRHRHVSSKESREDPGHPGREPALRLSRRGGVQVRGRAGDEPGHLARPASRPTAARRGSGPPTAIPTSSRRSSSSTSRRT